MQRTEAAKLLGKEGGKARARNMREDERSKAAQHAANTRWNAVRMRFYDRPSDVEPYPPTHVQRLQNFNQRNQQFWERKRR